MADRRPLLPHSATPLERSAATACADIEEIPIPLRKLRRAAVTPDSTLTWLAWERSVDRWDERWTIEVKRRAVANSFFIHKHKGTIGALRRVVEPLGYLLNVTEWWQTTPPGRRGTFQLTIGVLDTGISEAMYDELLRLIDDAKRQSQHMTGLQIAAEVRGVLNVNVAAYDGDTITVYPFDAPAVEIAGAIASAVASHIIDTMTVYP